MVRMRKAIIIFILLFLINYTHASGEEVYILSVEGVIDPITSDYVRRGIKEAEDKKAEALIIQMNTPGGLESSMSIIIEDILNSDVPVVVYVYPKGAGATSAGSFILVASHIAAMSPGTTVGAAHPVAMGGGGEVSEKIVNYAASKMKSLAELKNRNVSLATSFVLNSISITDSEALKYGIVDMVVDNYDSLLDRLDGMEVEVKSGTKILHTKNAEPINLPMSPIEAFLHMISNPNIAYILFLAGMYGIIFELSNPGAILPGVIGGICILLAFWSFQALSLSATGLALIIFAIILFIAELKTPTHGILTAGGIISLFLGSLMLIDVEKEPFVKISLGVIASATAFTALFFVFAIGFAIKAQRKRPTTGIEGMIGLVGTTKEDLKPDGNIFIRGERWKARAKEGSISKGRKIKVVGVDNLTLEVVEVK